MAIHENRKILFELLTQKAALKQDIAADGLALFKEFKSIISEEIDSLAKKVKDPRIRLYTEVKGDFEIYVYIGSDVLVFHLHNNVFYLPETDGFWNVPYLKNDPSKGYFNSIYVYNFLAESMIQNRVEDLGYLIARICSNQDRHFFTEGKGAFQFQFRDLQTATLKKKEIQLIVQTAFAQAIDFDLLIPPFEMMEELMVGQILQISEDLQLKTGKRLGFKRKEEEDEIF